jgi:hypothetical protein
MYHVRDTVPPDAAVDDSVGLRNQFMLLRLGYAYPRVILFNVADEVMKQANRALLTPSRKLCLLTCRMERVSKHGDGRVVVRVLLET